MITVIHQTTFRPALPNTYGASDYRDYRDLLAQIDANLLISGLECELVEVALRRWVNASKNPPSEKQKDRKRAELRYGLRCNIGRCLTGESYRQFSIHLSDSALLQWFTGIHYFEARKAASKSSLERYGKLFKVEEIEMAVERMLSSAADAQMAPALGLNQRIEIDEIFSDCTCVKANIHFPVDWVLLRDAVRVLIAGIKLIRKHGLKHRIPEPSTFLKRVNTLSIEMTHARRRADSKRVRKRVLRLQKDLVKTVEKHAVRYVNLLKDRWEETDWSKAQAQQVLNRMEGVLQKLPAAKKQAHERIIGERRVPNQDKILSLHEEDIHILVRGKAGAEVEFGNGCYLAEQADGLIVDWQFFKDQPPADSKLVEESIARIESKYGSIGSFTADRGFDSTANAALLKEKEIYNGICPKNPAVLAERLEERRFENLQSRRAQTEGRIGIFKNVYLGSPLRSKGFIHRELSVAWCVLSHNLWVVARMALANERQQAQAA